MGDHISDQWATCTIFDLIGSEGLFADGDWIETKDQDPNGSVRLIQLADVGDGYFKDKSSRYLSSQKAKDLGCTFLKKGDVLISRLPDPLGKCCVFPLVGNNSYVTAVDVSIVRLHPDIDPVWFSLFFNSVMARTQVYEHQSGSTRPRISRKNLGKVVLSCPPQNEQRRIVAKIEELFSELDKGVESLKTARAQLKTYRQSLLKAAFEGRLTEQWRRDNADQLETADQLLQRIREEREARYQQQLEEWKVAVSNWEAGDRAEKKPVKPSKIKELPRPDCSNKAKVPKSWSVETLCNITYKIGDVDHKMPKSSEEGIPYLSTGDLREDGSIDFSKAKRISGSDFERLAAKIKPQFGDIIFPRYGTIGRNCLVSTDKDFLVSYSCAIVKNVSEMDGKYVYYFTLSPWAKKEIGKYTRETTQRNIGIASIENFEFPLCSLAEQRQVVSILDEHLSRIDEQIALIDKVSALTNALRNSILKRAFEGKLIPQDPNDEPASALLERIRQEQADEPKAGRHKRKVEASA